MSGYLITNPRFFVIDGNGNPIRGGLVYSYIAETTTAKSLYSDKACTVAYAQGFALDSDGGKTIYGTGTYKINVTTSAGAQVPGYPIDNVGGGDFGTDEITVGSINRAAGTLTIEIGGTAELSITSAATTLGGNLIIPDGGTVGQAAGPLLTFDDTNNYLEISGGSVLLGDTSNTNITQGITINQGANTDTILALKSSTVAHGMTTLAETDTFGSFAKGDGSAGGLGIVGFKDADGSNSGALTLTGRLAEAADTTHTAAGYGIISLDAQITDGGTSATTAGADQNLFSVGTAGSTKFIIDAEGDLFADGSDVTVYDDHDDAELIRSFTLERAKANKKTIPTVPRDNKVKAKHSKGVLEDNKFIGKVDTKGEAEGVRPLYNVVGVQHLQNGAIWQLRMMVEAMAEALDEASPAFKAKLAARMAEKGLGNIDLLEGK